MHFKYLPIVEKCTTFPESFLRVSPDTLLQTLGPEELAWHRPPTYFRSIFI